jgi:hypothetical protein
MLITPRLGLRAGNFALLIRGLFRSGQRCDRIAAERQSRLSRLKGDVPPYFWEDFTTQGSNSQDWEQGLFAGRGRRSQDHGWITLNGVHFLRSSLNVLLPAMPAPGDGKEPVDPRKPALSEAELRRWWDKLAGARDTLTQEQLRAPAANHHLQNTISRERIRALADGRKPGPGSN